MESAPGWMQVPWPMLVLLSWPHGPRSAFPPTQAVLLAVGKWEYRGQMVLLQPGSSSQHVRDFFLPGSCSKNSVGFFLKYVFEGNLTKESAIRV